jgi:NADH-quinone oxidoreductase subunit E
MGEQMAEKPGIIDLQKAYEIIAKYKSREGILVEVLHEIQREFGYLPSEVLLLASKLLNIPLAQIYGVASFYTQFYFTPRGKNIIRVCTGTACHIRGAMAVLERFENELGIKAGETTTDLQFTLETVNCVGCCGLAPVVVANERVVKKREHQKIIPRLRGESGE